MFPAYGIPVAFAALLGFLLAAHYGRLRENARAALMLGLVGAYHASCYISWSYPAFFNITLMAILGILVSTMIVSLFLTCLFEGHRKLPVWVWLVGPVLLIALYGFGLERAVSLTVNILGLGYGGWMAVLYRRHHDYMVDNLAPATRRWLALLMVWCLVINGLEMLVFAGFLFGAKVAVIEAGAFIGSAVSTATGLMLLWMALGAEDRVISMAAGGALAQPVATPEQQDIYDRCARLVGEGEVITDFELNVATLSDKLAVTPRELSEAINSVTGNNVPALIRAHRVRFAKKRLLEAPRDANILDIALEAGFRSKSSFNEAFRRETGMTPSDFRTQAQAGTQAATVSQVA